MIKKPKLPAPDLNRIIFSKPDKKHINFLARIIKKGDQLEKRRDKK
ncbi:MAG: hypothetical protein AB1467_03065 [Candidatus Diapherotrites archaeon]